MRQIEQRIMNWSRIWPHVVGLSTLASVVMIAPAYAGELTQWSFDPVTNRLDVVTSTSIKPRHLLMAQPARIILDLPNIKLGNIATQKRFPTGAVQQIRVSQYQPDVARIVLELSPDAVLDPRQVALEPVGGNGNTAPRWILRPLLASSSPVGSRPSQSATSSSSGTNAVTITAASPEFPPSSADNTQGIPIAVTLPETPPNPTPSARSATRSSLPGSSPASSLPQLGPTTTTPTAPVAMPTQPPTQPIVVSPQSKPPVQPSPVVSPRVVSSSTTTAQTVTEVFPPAIMPSKEQVTVTVPAPDQAAALPTRVESIGQSPSVSPPVAPPPATPRPVAPVSVPPPVATTPIASAPSQPSPLPTLSPAPSTAVSVPSSPPASPPAATTAPPSSTLPSSLPVSSRSSAIDFGQPLPIARSSPSTTISLPPSTSNPGTATPVVPFGTAPVFNSSVPRQTPPPPTVSPHSNAGVIYAAITTKTTSGTILPSGTVLSVRYPGTTPLNLQTAIGRQDVLLLQTEIRSASGQVIFSAGTPIIGQFQLTSQGGQFITQAIVLADRNIPLMARSEFLPTSIIQPNQTLQISLTDTLTN
ncbi:MAG: AMIN domain-containing protein [Cyanobacteria bacterium]|nr:AMIN domain-containing protein [Cyanobacteriota bacterium]MDW8201288.1 AMIN domain-containing protein [Cyanobacteriota bacterium SKYGB_h_bin112]